MQPHRYRLSPFVRRLLFMGLVGVFLVVTPIVWFYATGYQFTLKNTQTQIVSTGGIYIARLFDPSVTLFINDEPIHSGMREFSHAYYVSGLATGEYRVNTQAEGRHTWVKNLPVTASFVSDALSFNLPLQPTFTTLAATSSEYTRARALFAPTASSTSSSTAVRIEHTFLAMQSVLDTLYGRIREQGSVLHERSGMQLVRQGDVLRVHFTGVREQVPPYLCDHIGTTTSCRFEQRIDTQGRKLLDADFYINTTDLLLVLRDDGLFLTEVDPRGGFQNTQPLLRGSINAFRVSGNEVYIQQGKTILVWRPE